MDNVVVLVSGGLDSVVLTHYLRKVKKIQDIKLIFVNYGQKSFEEELFCVKRLAEDLDCGLEIIDSKWLGKISTSLINKTTKQNIKEIKEDEEIISWYVPCRNAIFLLIGLAVAEAEFISKKKKYDIYFGIKYEGNLKFKDTTPEFLEQMNKLTGFCTQEGKFNFIAPFLNKEKEEVIELAEKLKVDFKKTYSCYIGKGFDKKGVPIHCGVCGSCKARKKAFKFSKVGDLTVYKNVQTK
ncbi:MAG: 7-cyano-7-deazaguanine synthase [archaeon]